MSAARPQHAQGLRRHPEAGLQEADHAAVPGVQAAGLPALPRPPPAAPARERAREVRRLLALRRRLPGRLHPRRRRREHRREPRLGRRALRAHLRDQHEPLHLLRLLRARLPVRRDHARERVRDLRVQPRRPHLHEGHAARAAGEAACRSPTRDLYDTPIPYYKTQLVARWRTSSSGSSGSAPRSPASRARSPSSRFRNPFFSALALIGNLGSLAVLYLLLGGEFVAAGQVLVYAGAVMVMFLFVIAYLGDRTLEAPWAGGPSWQAIGAALAGGAILVEVIVAIGLDDRRRARRRRRTSTARSARPRRSGRCSSPTTCSRSRSPRSCCSSRRSAASCSARTRARAGGASPSRSRDRGGAMHGPEITWYLVLAGDPVRHRRARRARSAAAR